MKSTRDLFIELVVTTRRIWSVGGGSSMHIWTKSSASVEEKGRKDDLSHKTQPAFLDHFADLQDSMVKKEQLTSVYPNSGNTQPLNSCS